MDQEIYTRKLRMKYLDKFSYKSQEEFAKKLRGIRRQLILGKIPIKLQFNSEITTQTTLRILWNFLSPEEHFPKVSGKSSSGILPEIPSKLSVEISSDIFAYISSKISTGILLEVAS